MAGSRYLPHGQQYSLTPCGVGNGSMWQPSASAATAEFEHDSAYSLGLHASLHSTDWPLGVVTLPSAFTVEPEGTWQI